MHHLKVGKRGEKLAVRFLKKKRYKILERNYSTKFGEIDIVAKDGDSLVFVEVKTRSWVDYGYPEEAIGQKKLERLIKTAHIYIDKNNVDMPVRFDAVSVEVPGKWKKPLIIHWQDITS